MLFRSRGESPGTIAEVVFYRPDGTGFTRVPGQGATRQFAWTVRARQDARGEGYAFISGDGGDDGAAVTYAAERQAVQFSDATYGPAFSFGVLRDCWPRPAGAPPAGLAACSTSDDATTTRLLAAERQQAADYRRGQLAAERGEFTTRPGSVYVNDLGNTLTVTRVAGRRVTFRNQSGAEFESHAMLYAFNPDVQGNEAAFAAVDSLWPLAPGKTAQATVRNADGVWQFTWTVRGRERISVPAGTFDAWAIEQTERAVGGRYVGRSVSWYAPQVGWNVRYFDRVESDPRAPRSEWQLERARPAL